MLRSPRLLHRRNADCRLRRGFTILELMVVVAMLAILISLLLPTITKAREAANRAVCASNLRQIGIACRLYAADNNNYFPAFYHIPNPPANTTGVQDNYSFPPVISDDETLYDNTAKDVSKHDPNPISTRWLTFLKYGTTPNTWHCPGAPRGLGYLSAAISPPQWGPVVWTSYMYVGGMTTKNIGNS